MREVLSTQTFFGDRILHRLAIASADHTEQTREPLSYLKATKLSGCTFKHSTNPHILASRHEEAINVLSQGALAS
jgi:hypothetical protein